jgi:hypothetical protein
MRTKTLLLSVGALLAAGFVSSQAQPVYSQNIVGYASLPTPGDGATYYMLTCPFVIGASNGLNEVFGTNTLPDTSTVLTWTGGSYQAAVYATIGDENIPGVQWYTDQSESTPLNPMPTIPPGKSFFIQPAPGLVTNVFAGVVATPVGGTNRMTIVGDGATYYAVASVIPFAGYITNAVNLTNLPDTSVVLTWTGGSYLSTVFASADDENIPGVQWYTDQSESTPAPCPFVSVGEGFFIQPAPGTFTWSQTLPSN